MPVTVIAGPDQIREPSPPVPKSGSARLDLGELAELVVAVGRARPLLAPQAGDGDVAVLVVQRGERVQQRDQRVGRRAAELAAVLRPGERRHLDRDHRHAAQRDRQRRHAGPDAAHVADHHRVAREQVRDATAGTC